MNTKIYASQDWVAENAVLPPAVATVGQSLIVKSVDENDKPTEWGTINIPIKNIEDVTKFTEKPLMTGFYFYLADPLPNGFYYYDADKYGKMLYIVIVNAENTAVDRNFPIYYPRFFHITSNDTDIVITVYSVSGEVIGYVYNIADKTYVQTGLTYTASAVDDLLDNKVSSPAIAEIGQLLAIKTIDENGKPTEWEAVDYPSKASSLELVDRTTGKTYNVYIDNGKLTMEEVTE
jgi:hypothetical protein